MDKAASVSRENQKNRLRSQIIPGGAQRPRQQEEEFKSPQRKPHRHRLILLFFVLMVSVALAGVYLYRRYHQYTSYQVLWEHNFYQDKEGQIQSSSDLTEYEHFEDGVLKYTRDGISYISSNGKVIWNQSYEMKSPVMSVNGGYAAVADQEGTSIYICDKNGCQGQATTQLPVPRVAVSEKGVVAAMQEDSIASYIQMYRKDGSSLDISIKALLSGDGCPVDISLSPGGTQLLVSYLYLENGILKSKVVYYNFGLGKDDPKRIVGILFSQDLNDGIVARVKFLDDAHSVIFSDRGLFFVSTRVETEPEVMGSFPVEEEIRSICYSDRYVGIVTDNIEGEDPCRLRVFDQEGKKIMERTFRFQYSSVDIDGDMVFLYDDRRCQVYNMKGILKFEGDFDFTLSRILKGRFPDTLLLAGPQYIKEIKLQ